ncbi:LamG domain-containing protein [Flavobacterium sp. F372]|uniref:LamG domain-containing protein n=1 Tax=Flavobacterium bernardetii TaxID=2813823 RepID=A0ABR7J0E9_9FLAO|nr:LamG domain-containing protein [Flavobacterium bernardetii]MBC5835232.1 LamG domain-containing protein [Flavobacterium bernardetii]NHF71379.1 LamG domain-containing protein [Flavobacterium bernardetii]
MKKINQIGIVFLLFMTISCEKSEEKTNIEQINCLPPNLQNGVIAFYSFANGSLDDSSGNNYNLTNSTTASSGMDRAGNSNCAFIFVKANNEFLKYTNPTFLDNFQTLPFSISLWYKPLSLNSGFEVLIGRDSGLHCPNTSGQWSVSLYDCRKPVFGINQHSLWDDYSNSLGCAETLADLSNVWQHLVVTCNGTDLKLYKNGVLTTRLPGSGCSTNIPTINAGDLFLGKNYNGLLDDVIIYNNILSQFEITQLYNLQPCCQ